MSCPIIHTVHRIYMASKRSSFIGNLGRWLSAEILVFTTALLLMSLFAFLSFANAFLSALLLVIVVVLYKAVRKKQTSEVGRARR